MRQLIVFSVSTVFLAGAARAGFSPGNWTNVGSHHLKGDPGNVVITYEYTGPPFRVGTFEWSGNGEAFATSRPYETRCWITAPSGKGAPYRLATGFSGEFVSSGLSEYFNGTQAVGTWTFEFYESYDDYSPDPDAIHYNIQFTFNDDYVTAPAFPTRETFNYGIPDDWTVVDVGTGDWQLSSYFLRDNYTGGDGTCAMMDSGWYGLVYVDSELISPSFVVPPANAALEFDHDFNWLSDIYEEIGNVDIYTAASGWQTLATYAYGDFNGHVSLDLSAYAGQEAQVRFHYWWFAYNQMWWQVDNVAITPIPGDLDDDGDVDGDDLELFVDCLLGPGVTYTPGCDDADLDSDADVDLADFAAFQAAFTGPLP